MRARRAQGELALRERVHQSPMASTSTQPLMYVDVCTADTPLVERPMYWALLKTAVAPNSYRVLYVDRATTTFGARTPAEVEYHRRLFETFGVLLVDVGATDSPAVAAAVEAAAGDADA